MNKFNINVLSVIWGVITTVSFSQTETTEVVNQSSNTAVTNAGEDTTYFGFPQSTEENRDLKLLHKKGFSVGYCEKMISPAWVTYCLSPNPNLYNFSRPSFRVDRSVKSPPTDAFFKTGYDRGHLAPNYAIMTRFGRTAQLDSFLMTNILPMNASINRGIWAGLESLIAREYANTLERVWVTTGPIYDNEIKKFESGVEIPDFLYKVVIDELEGKPRALSFIVPNARTEGLRYENCLASVDQIEQQTGLDFFHALEDKLEEILESKKPQGLWKTQGKEKLTPPSPGFKVNIEDEEQNNLENLARNALKNSLTLEGVSKIQNLKRLRAPKMGIENLMPIESLTKVEELSLMGNNLDNLKQISNYKSLRYLNLGYNKFKIVPEIKNFLELRKLYIDKNHLSDISPLYTLRKLEDLSLRNNQITKLESLSNLVSLSYLNLSQNKIEDLSPLKNLNKLTRLYLSNNQIRDIKPLSDLGLVTLDLKNNNITSIASISDLKNLSELNLSGNKIHDYTPLKELDNLRVLYLSKNIEESQKSLIGKILDKCNISYVN